MPVSVQITLIVTIAVIACAWFFAAVVKGQQQVEEAQANAAAAEAMVKLAEFAERQKEGDDDK